MSTHPSPSQPSALLSSEEAAVHTPDPELSEQLYADDSAQLVRTATTAGALLSAQQRIASLESEVAQLRAEAQWKEAVWNEERASLQARIHDVELESARKQTRLELQLVEQNRMRQQTERALTDLGYAEREISALRAKLTAQKDRIQLHIIGTHQLQEQLLERERIVGALWQTLREYRSLGFLQRLFRRPQLPSKDKNARLLLNEDRVVVDETD